MAEIPEQPVDYSVCTESDAAEMVQLLAEVFAHRDPPAVAAGLSPGEFASFVSLFAKEAGTSGLTVIARSRETGEMCGALLTEDAASEMPEGVEQLSSRFDPVFDILGQLDDEYRADLELHPGEAVHLFLLGVEQSSCGKGIAKTLVSKCLENAGSRGYRLAITEATNKTSQHIFRKHGFTERVRRSYGDHRFDGQAVFASIADQGGPILMDRALAGGK